MRPVTRRSLAGTAAALWLLASAGCRAPAGGPPAPSADGDPCELVAPVGPAPAMLRVGTVGPLRLAGAPVPVNEAEAFVFAHVYEGLVAVDCEGTVRAAVARGWEGDADGRRWTFEIHPDARFWTGEPVTARAVLDGWRAVQSRVSPASGIRSIEVVGPRRLAVHLDQPSHGPPVELTDPAFAVVRVAVGRAWPRVGTGPYRIDEPPAPGVGPPGRTALRLVRRTQGPSQADTRSGAVPRAGPDTIEVFHLEGGDGRDLLDAGAELLVSRDPATLAYAERIDGVRAVALPFDRTYVLHVPGAVDRDRGAEEGWMVELARDAVRESARPGTSLTPGSQVRACVAGPEAGTAGVGLPGEPRRDGSPATGSSGARVVAHPGDDSTALALASRLVALAAEDRGGPLQTTGDAGRGASGGWVALAVPTGRFGEVLGSAAHPAYVFAVNRPSHGCAAAFGPAFQPPEGSGATVPLVDTRPTLLSRAPGLAVVLGPDGRPRLGSARPVGRGR